MKKRFFNLSVKGKILLIIIINISFMMVAGVTTVFVKMFKTASVNESIFVTVKVGDLLQKTDVSYNAIRADLYRAVNLDSGNIAAHQLIMSEFTLHKEAITHSISKAIEIENNADLKNKLEVLNASLVDYIKNTEQLMLEKSNASTDFKDYIGVNKLKDHNASFEILTAQFAKTTSLLQDHVVKLQGIVEDSIIDLVVVLGIVMILAIAIAVYLSLNIIKYITNPIVITEHILTSLHAGEIVETVVVKGNDETARMLKSLNGLVTNLANVKNFVTEVGNGNFNTDIAIFDNKGDIYESLNKMKNDLKQTAEDDRKRSWATEGVAKFSEILRSNNDNLSVLTNTIIANLVKYLNANQAGLFLVNDSDSNHKYLELVACYAWNRKKYLNMRVELGEGLVGQAWQENDTVYITDVPDDFVKISSGLGDSNPTSFLIVPLIVNDVTYGILEIASFVTFEVYQIDFLKKIAESIASTISTAKINERTKQLLEQSQQQAEEMRAQEEEMRQNMEEMHATQEEMQRKETEMLAMIEKMNNKQ